MITSSSCSLLATRVSASLASCWDSQTTRILNPTFPPSVSILLVLFAFCVCWPFRLSEDPHNWIRGQNHQAPDCESSLYSLCINQYFFSGILLVRNASAQSRLRTTEEPTESSSCTTSQIKTHSTMWSNGYKRLTDTLARMWTSFWSETSVTWRANVQSKPASQRFESFLTFFP